MLWMFELNEYGIIFGIIEDESHILGVWVNPTL